MAGRKASRENDRTTETALRTEPALTASSIDLCAWPTNQSHGCFISTLASPQSRT